MQKLLIAESSCKISKSIEELLSEDWIIHISNNGYEAADMMKYIQPTATIIDSSLLQNSDLDFLKNFSMLIGLSSPANDRVADILNAVGNPPRLVSRHLHLLNFNFNLDGTMFLIAAIPLYAERPDQRLHKELYPAVQTLCNATSTACIERSIRAAIHSAWKKRDLSVWTQYFPIDSNDDIQCPSNGAFIAQIASKL